MCAVAPKVPRLIPTARRRWFVVEGDPATPDRWMESQVGEKRNGVSENVEMVVEVTGEIGEIGKTVEVGETDEGCMGVTGEISEMLGETGELGRTSEVLG